MSRARGLTEWRPGAGPSKPPAMAAYHDLDQEDLPRRRLDGLSTPRGAPRADPASHDHRWLNESDRLYLVISLSCLRCESTPGPWNRVEPCSLPARCIVALQDDTTSAAQTYDLARPA